MSATRPFLCILCCLPLVCGLAEFESEARQQQQQQQQQPADSWLGLELGSLLRDCPRARPLLGSLARCARRRALAAIDRILEDDRVPIVAGLELVKYQQLRSHASPRSPINDSVTFSTRDLLARIRKRDQWLLSRGGGEAHEADEEDDVGGGWRARLIERLARVLKTHVIKIDTERLAWPRHKPAAAAAGAGQVESRGRRRRRRQMQMMPIVMMGVLLMGSVLIPMGFQFLAVLGGKALILAKMALMLSSIQGLKKIATNGVNYGLYHTPVPEPWHERSTAGLELPSYAHLNYAAAGAGYSLPAAQPPAPGYLDQAGLGYLASRRSASAPLQPVDVP